MATPVTPVDAVGDALETVIPARRLPDVTVAVDQGHARAVARDAPCVDVAVQVLRQPAGDLRDRTAVDRSAVDGRPLGPRAVGHRDEDVVADDRDTRAYDISMPSVVLVHDAPPSVLRHSPTDAAATAISGRVGCAST